MNVSEKMIGGGGIGGEAPYKFKIHDTQNISLCPLKRSNMLGGILDPICPTFGPWTGFPLTAFEHSVAVSGLF